jgi:ubiquinone biosynthesis UbiH/UbiF/VisC/COQ6 family hydroxylase|tara:strand:- start:1526 stop:2713 length:1188 start_codon:yes stop_codon:yes gene_type:complete
MNSKKNKMIFDIAIIGAGPVGIAFACSFAKTNMKIVIIEKLPKKILAKPRIDGREIALTHRSADILKELNVWQNIPAKLITTIKEARVLNGNSKYFLDFTHQQLQKECLGYLIPNNLIRKYLYKRLTNIPNVTLIDKVNCISIDTGNNEYSSIQLSNGEKIKASLIVASDSRFSKARSMMNISAFIHDFNKNMIVCRMEHEKPHNNIAYEFFRYTQTQASLPYIKKQSSIVTTVSRKTSKFLMKIDNKKFNKEIRSNFNNFFGEMKLIGKRYSYPMITTYSKKFVAHRFALIGDAAVGMHPVTAHGFNLGLKGLEIITKEIKSAIKHKIDFGSPLVLRKYQYKLHRIAIPIYLGTNGIVSLYTNTTVPAMLARQFILKAVNLLKPVKQTFLQVLR